MARQPTGRPRGRPRKDSDQAVASAKSKQAAKTKTASLQPSAVQSTSSRTSKVDKSKGRDLDAGKKRRQEDDRDTYSAASDDDEEEDDDDDVYVSKKQTDATHEDSQSDASDAEQDKGQGTSANQRQMGRPRGSGPSMRKWRRLAVEEKELLTTEGGLIWQAARPIIARMHKREAREARQTLLQALLQLEGRLDNVLVPPTITLPHMARTATGPLGSAAGIPILSSLMSWRMERGERVYYDDEDEEEDPDETIQPSIKSGTVGFAADVALLEGLLLPEAVEAVSLTRALDEQEHELVRLRQTLSRLRATYRATREDDDVAASELERTLARAKRRSDEARVDDGDDEVAGVTAIDDLALREAARLELTVRKPT